VLLLIRQSVAFFGHLQQRGAVLTGRQAPGHEMEITRKLPILFRFAHHNRLAVRNESE
jgi:hypothetical protein